MLNDLCWTNKTLPIESFDVKLVTRAAAQFFDSVVEEAVSDVYRFPFSIFRFVMYSKTMNRGFLLFFQFQFDDDRIGCGSRQRYFWREWGSYSNRSYQNKFDWIDFFFKFQIRPWTLSWWLTVSCPYLFSTVQVYSPASSRVTSRMSSDPSGIKRTRSEAT